MWIFKREPPPPPPVYKRRPIATIAVILTAVGMFVLGPVGAIYNSMSEELKQKVDNKTLQLMIEKDRDALQRTKEVNKQQQQAIVENQKAIQLLLREQAVLKVEKKIEAPKKVVIKEPETTIVKKNALTPEEFSQYLKMTPQMRVKYKKYLKHIGKDVSGLPE